MIPGNPKLGAAARWTLIAVAGLCAAALPAFGNAESVVRTTVAVTAGESEIDLVAERGYMRTGANSGPEIPAPEPGLSVRFHLDWRFEGSGPAANVTVRALLDGNTFCSTSSLISPGNAVTTFCNTSWSATAGSHTLRWELDYTQTVSETSSDNNSVSRTWRAGVQIDVIAVRAFLRTGINSGAEVMTPTIGQEVYFHVEWRVANAPAGLEVVVRAQIDSVPVCSGPLDSGNGEIRTAWCSTPWVATPGFHTLEWVLDPDDLIAEQAEVNNLTFDSWASEATTPTIPATSTAAPISTPTLAMPTATRIPTVAASPPPTFVAGLFDVFQRGDTDCSGMPTAADVVGVLADEDTCENADCDRNGVVEEEDLDCTARCLFGTCAVPDHAPRILAVEPVSTSEIQAFGLIRITVDGLSEGEVPRSVRVGYRRSVIVGDPENGKLFAIVPNLPAGPTSVVVGDAELESPPFGIEIAELTAVGDPSTIADLVDVILDVIDAVLELDIDALYGESATVLARELEALRRSLPGALDDVVSDPAYTGTAGRQLDEWIDGSGTVELLRRALDDLDSATSSARTSGAGALATVLRDAGRTVIAGGSATALAGGEIATAEGAVTLGGSAVLLGSSALAGAAVVFGGAAVVWSIDTPVLRSISPNPVQPGTRLTLLGAGFGDLPTPNLILETERGQTIELTVPLVEEENEMAFLIPKSIAVCGRMNVYLRRPVIGSLVRNRSHGVELKIQPTIEEVLDDTVEPPNQTRWRVLTTGIGNCPLLFSGDCARYRQRDGEERSFCWPRTVSRPNLTEYKLPHVVPGPYEVTLQRDGIESDFPERITFGSSLTPEIKCNSRTVEVGQRELCAVDLQTPLIDLQQQLPGGAVEVEWSVDPADVLDVADDNLRFFLDFEGAKVGAATLGFTLVRTDVSPERRFGHASAEIEVVLTTPPTLTVTPDSPLLINTGDVIQVTATARAADGAKMKSLRLTADSSAIDPGDRFQEITCPGFVPGFPELGSRNCVEVFTLDVLSDLPASQLPEEVVVSMTGVDTFDNESDPVETTFTFAVGDIGGTVFDAEDGNAVPDSTVQLFNETGALIDEIRSGGGSFLFETVAAGHYTVTAQASGYLPGNHEVELGGGDVLDLRLEIEPLNGPGTMIATVRSRLARGSLGDPIEGASVSVLNRNLQVLVNGLTGSDGNFEARDLPVGEYLMRAEFENHATFYKRFDIVVGGGVQGTLAGLYPANPSCSTDVETFRVLRARTVWGNSVPMFEREPRELFDDPPGPRAEAIDPKAAVICLTGLAGRPTIDWHRPWANELLIRPPVDKVSVNARRIVADNRSEFFNLIGAGEIFPPVTYGVESQGVDRGPFEGSPPDLPSGEPLFVVVGGVTVVLDFELR